MVSVIILYYNRICGPSLTETSLCGAWLYSAFHPALFRVCILHYTECVCCIIRVIYCLCYTIEMVPCWIKQRCPCYITQSAHVACYWFPWRSCFVGTRWCVIHRVQNVFGCNNALSVGLLVVTWDWLSFGATLTESSIARLGKPQNSLISTADCISVPGISLHWCSQYHIFRTPFIRVS